MDKISFALISALVVAIVLFSPMRHEPTRGLVSVVATKNTATKALLLPQKTQVLCRYSTVETQNENGEVVSQKVRVCN